MRTLIAQEDLRNLNASSQCWQNVGHCRLSQALDLACSLAPKGCTRQNLGLLLVSQTAEPEALAAAASFLGVEPSFFTSLDHMELRRMNRAEGGRHEKQALCRPQLAALRGMLRGIFRAEYGALAARLTTFELVPGSAQELLEMEDWACLGDG